jgi:hypothetical protein
MLVLTGVTDDDFVGFLLLFWFSTVKILSKCGFDSQFIRMVLKMNAFVSKLNSNPISLTYKSGCLCVLFEGTGSEIGETRGYLSLRNGFIN